MLVMRQIMLFIFLVASSIGAGAAPKPPAENEAKALVLDSVLAFNKAVQTKDFTSFHQQTSALWQKQITPQKLKEIFQTFIDQEIDLSGVSKVEAVLSESAKADDDGVLVVQGHYPTTPLRVDFRLKYVNEKGAWKLFGIKVDAKPSGGNPGTLPSEKEARDLLLESLLAFNKAIVGKDFAGFYQEIAAVWRQQTTAEKLQANFQSFIDKEVDISSVTKFTSAFDPPPAINEDGLLELKGFYPTRPQQMGFDLAYIYEAPEWKLVKIKVNLSAEEEDEE